MGRYLNKFRSVLPGVQVTQINKLLNGMKNDGSIKTIKEYNQKLQDLTKILQETNPTPSFKLLLGYIGDLISSARYNVMTQAIANDLEAAFLEAEQIASVLETHKTLFDLTILDSIEKSINELERNIDLYEYVANSPHKFSDAQYVTFNETECVFTPRTDSEADNLYYDYRLREGILEEESCEIDSLGEQLLMPAGTLDEVSVINVSLIHDSLTTFPLRDLQSSTQDLQNIRDGKIDTWWLYPVISKNKLESATIKLRFDFGGQRRLNSIYIEPQTTNPVILESYSYIGPNGILATVDNVEEMIPPTRMVYLGNIETNVLILTFRQENSISVAYHYDAAKQQWEGSVNIDQTVQSIITNPITREVLGFTESQEQTEEQTGYQYTFGFDNIRFYLTEYLDRGIFVSKKFTVKRPISIGLQVEEFNYEISEFSHKPQRFSFEYVLYKKNYNENGSHIDTEIIPLLPLNQTNVSGERLFLITKDDEGSINNIARLRFTPVISNIEYPIVRLNHGGSGGAGLVLGTAINGDDFEVQVDGEGEWCGTWEELQGQIDNQPDSKVPVTVNVRFFNANQSGIYTVDYQASRRTTSSNQRKLSKEISILDNSLLRCFIEKPGNNIVESADLYLIVVMRNNWITSDLSCMLGQYKLLVSKQDDNKYIG